MKNNIGTSNKVVKILVAIVIAGLYFINLISGTTPIILLIPAGIFILTGFISFRPMYYPVGIFTRKKGG